tara:strand:+ start:824 stop:1105 length:282 start_codon:yes stop_codon:yes gene_type:complete
VELFEAAQKITYLSFGRVTIFVIGLGRADDDIGYIREASTAAAALGHAVINLGGNNKLPTVLVEQLDDGLFNFLFGNEIATANQHASTIDISL